MLRLLRALKGVPDALAKVMPPVCMTAWKAGIEAGKLPPLICRAERRSKATIRADCHFKDASAGARDTRGGFFHAPGSPFVTFECGGIARLCPRRPVPDVGRSSPCADAGDAWLGIRLDGTEALYHEA